ncbi:MAG TPA: glutamate synthase large subunit [Gemmatimonadales bacterium]|nr:glutamate synthase large subunit [Gemmatimonadales bacterium]
MTEDHGRRTWDRTGAGPTPDPWREKDACGVGLIARASGAPARAVTDLALTALARLAHRGAASSDHSGDGAGILTQIPRRLLAAEAAQLGLPVDPDQPFAVGMFFLPAADDARAAGIGLVEQVLTADGFTILGWRDVPVVAARLAGTARATSPVVRQVFVAAPGSAADDTEWESRLYLSRREIERRTVDLGWDPFFVCSLSCRTIVYKALLTGPQLPAFYEDLRRPEYETAIAVFHQRYATNTAPKWTLAQPFRMLAHNGEINTLWGNRNAMLAREPLLASPQWGAAIERVKPVIWPDGSDSASLDNALELLVRSGRDPVHALMMLVPEPLDGVRDADPVLRGFYRYHEALVEPWDGPAALALSDGVTAIAAVDRNGLRPCRYKITRDGVLIAASEVGVVDVPAEQVLESGRLAPGELIAVDTRRNAILHSAQAKREVAGRHRYARWTAQCVHALREQTAPAAPPAAADLRPRQVAFGYGFEDMRYVVQPMSEGQDPLWSMGDDTPLPPLSRLPQSLYTYMRQRFAQVTNPAIDAIRESCVMSLSMLVGRRGSLLSRQPTAIRLVRLSHPVLLDGELAELRGVTGVQAITLPCLWPAGAGPEELRPALRDLCRAAEREIQHGARILILSDRGVDANHAPIPLLVAIGAIHNHLLHKGLRHRTGLVAEAGDAWDVHHIAALIGYGAEAVHPWVALETAAEGGGAAAVGTLRSSLERGLLKVLAKMGISTLSSYCGAQIFESVGLGAEVIDECFPGTASMIGGIGFVEIAEDVLARHRAAFPEAAGDTVPLPDHGRVRYRRDGEDHAWSPQVVTALRKAVETGSAKALGDFMRQAEAREPLNLRHLLGVRRGAPIPIGEVEPVEAIRQRFISTAMSLGALSPEAHATLAIAMNRMGARSNSGEGGEDPVTFRRSTTGDRVDNRIKQVASARFGVTTEYLTRADELEIKIAQGSKPGEGGQLPGHKVTELIARLRHATPGVALISPPPHHDIYSIEDLAQLIHDLKQVNRRARIGVKLVAEAGVGRVATGVAKAHADYVLVSGHNGGTGASPLSSIKHAGSPWELGVAETHAILTENGLRERIELRTDGGLRTAHDVIVAAALGAEAYGFGTAPLVAIGCAMARQCHLNSCPTGIATQRPELRRKFKGTPEQVIAYFTLIAEEVRQLLATMGCRSLQEVIGRMDLLQRIDRPERPRAQLLDLSLLLGEAPVPSRPPRYNHRIERPGIEYLDERILADLKPSLDCGRPFAGDYRIGNHHLSVGARIAGVISGWTGDAGLPAGSVRLNFRGSAGQSFGAFALPGMHLVLEGEANDYVGKGLCGGEIVVRPFEQAGYAAASHEHVILGNTVLYGATSGLLLAAGRAGDRFAIRNSGATAVVEGAGDHCCEYMTGGTVVVLGRVGRNFGAGMTSGVAYVLDEDGTLDARHNLESVTIAALGRREEAALRKLVRLHFDRTRSPRARTILRGWRAFRWRFRVVRARPAVAAPVAPQLVEETASR